MKATAGKDLRRCTILLSGYPTVSLADASVEAVNLRAGARKGEDEITILPLDDETRTGAEVMTWS